MQYDGYLHDDSDFLDIVKGASDLNSICRSWCTHHAYQPIAAHHVPNHYAYELIGISPDGVKHAMYATGPSLCMNDWTPQRVAEYRKHVTDFMGITK